MTKIDVALLCSSRVGSDLGCESGLGKNDFKSLIYTNGDYYPERGFEPGA